MADSKTAILITIDPEHEGGFQNEHGDPGNWTGGEVGVGELKGTKYGISAAQFGNLDIQNLTPDQAVAIYQEQYWKQYYSQINDQNVASKLFDMGVLFGVGTAVIYLQEVLKLKADGEFGPMTLQAVNDADPVSLLRAYKTILVSRALKIGADRPNERYAVADWIRRINS